jgi:cyclophilin family peptidyl-prolyl cis-trans isomerase
MPRSRRYRKDKEKPQWGKNNPQTKAKNRKIYTIVGIIAIVIIALSAFIVLEQDVLFAAPTGTASPSPTTSPTPSPSPSVMAEPEATPLTSPEGEYSADGTRVQLTVQGTDSQGSFIGNITIQMRDDKPITTSNFVNLANQGFYDGTIFHRVIVNFMIQGGQNYTVAEINDEIGNDNHNTIGTIAMAKTIYPNSATSEFFINVNNNSDDSTFDETYTVFGTVIGGMDIVTRISQVPCTTNPDMPTETSSPINQVMLIKAIVLP